MATRTSALAVDGAAPDWVMRSALDLEAGDWQMRNGHTARLSRRIDIPYKDGDGVEKVYPIWKGRCVECGEPMTWMINGCYAAVGRHRNDIIGK